MTDEANLPAQRRPSRPELSVTDAQREKVIDELRRHCGAGALTLDDFAERAARVWAAPTSMELDAIVADLPDLSTPDTQPALVGETRRRKIRRWVVAIMSGSNRRGRWRVGDELNAFCLMGGAEIDLREAEFDAPELHITAVAIMGGVEIIVPEGIDVDLDGIAIMGGKDAKLARVPLLPGAPRVRVTAYCLMGGVEVKSKRPQAEIRAARAAKKAEMLERVTLTGRGSLGRDLRRQIKREMAETIQATLQQSLETQPGAHGRRRAPERDHLTTTDEDAAAVRRRLKRNGRPEGTVTIMFTDIESSTEMTQRLGDEAASEIVKAHNDLIRAQVAACGGYEVKFRGDGFMLAFTSAAKGVRCAIGIQERIKEFAEAHPEAPISVCIGINSGEAVPDGNDFLGTAVNIAARLAESANGGEVLVSSVVRDLCSSTGEFKFLPEQQLDLKGISEPQRACLVSW